MTSREDGRRTRSRRTRQKVVSAAARRFVEHGYGDTTMDDIATAAGVAVQTVYYVFGTKRNVLAAVLDAGIAGDHDAVPIVERAWVDQLGQITDPAAAVAYLVTASVEIVVRATPTYEVLCRAATDPEVEELFAATRRGRRADQRRLVEVLWRAGHLRPGLELDTAADIFYALVNEEMYLLLGTDCGWDVDHFRSWTIAVVRQQLIGRSAGHDLSPTARDEAQSRW